MSELHETDIPSLKKDMGSKAVINTDLASLQRYKLEKQRRNEIALMAKRQIELEQEQANMNNKLDTLSNQMNEILSLLRGEK